MDTELTAARLGLRSMLDAANLNAPSTATVNQVMIGRQLVAIGHHTPTLPVLKNPDRTKSQ